MPFTKLVLQYKEKQKLYFAYLKRTELPREENMYFYKAVNLKCKKH